MTAPPTIVQLANLLGVSEDVARALAFAAGLHLAGLPADEVAVALGAMLERLQPAPGGPSH